MVGQQLCEGCLTDASITKGSIKRQPKLLEMTYSSFGKDAMQIFSQPEAVSLHACIQQQTCTCAFYRCAQPGHHKPENDHTPPEDDV